MPFLERKKEMRARAQKLNAITSIISEIVVFVFGLILPRMILSRYGSSCNGLVSSISQFLSFSVVLRSGIGAVTRASLFKPLANNDIEQISKIMKATRLYLRKVALIIGFGIIIFSVIYPFIVINEYPWIYSFAMVLVLGVTTFVENFFSINNMILLQADQKYYIQTISSVIAQVVGCCVSIVLMQMKSDMLIVKAGAAIALLSRPLFLEVYVKVKYNLDMSVEPDNGALKQRWDAFAQQLAIIINGNIDIVLITSLSILSNVSVYTIHYMVVNNIGKIVQAPTSGLGSAFGNMIAKGEQENLRKSFCFVEWGMFALSTVLFGITAVMLTPFVDIYTRSIIDVNYHQPLFGFIMVMAAFFNCLRIPYQLLVEAAGHFRQTRNGAILEVVLNIVISVVMLIRVGLIGVIIGTIIACAVRTLQYSVYAMRNILHISIIHIIKNYVIYSLLFVLGSFVMTYLFEVASDEYFSWCIQAIPVSVTFGAIVAVFSLIFNRNDVLFLVKRIRIKFHHW